MTDLHQQLLRKTRPLVGGGHLGAKLNVARAALRAVVELHAPVTYGTWTLCGACSQTEGREVLRFVAAPCPEVRAIARELGVQEDNHHG